jgi:hypothetical protein
MLLTALAIVLKVALLLFIVGGVAAIIIRGVRRSRANRGDPNWNSSRAQPGFEASARGAMPRTPIPVWVDWDDADPEDSSGRPPHRLQ